jgi:uncharacterized membrane protein YoaK (UPF0700 family)
MTTFLADVRSTLVPDLNGRHGPLPPILLSMTVVTGLVDAFSYLTLGHVFVANVTGNIVFLGFALAGAPGFSIGASVTAVAAFAAGALAGGRLGARYSDHRGRLHSSAAAIQAIFLAVALILAVVCGGPVTSAFRYPLIVVLAICMGVQNAAARKLAIPDLTTTVLTLTITGIAADSTLAGGTGSQSGRRLTAVAAMLAGALAGAALVLHARIYYPLLIALAAILTGSIMTYHLGKPGPEWVKGGGPAPSATTTRPQN